MIELLRIRNLALIEDMELSFSPGLNALTGETGAGKSIILKAIDILTGEKAEASLVRPGEEGAFVEALFTREEGETILRREISPQGRARSYLDGKLATREAMLELRPGLVIQAGQHGQQRLLQPAFQAALLDAFLPSIELLEKKNLLCRDLEALRGQVRELDQRRESLEQKRELLEFQKSEIDKVAPRKGEEAELLERKKLGQTQSKARQAVGSALDLLAPGENGLLDGLARLARQVALAAELHPALSAGAEKVEDFRLELRELSASLRLLPSGLSEDFDPEAVESRLFELSQLRRKLKRPLEEIVALAEEIKENLDFLDSTGLERQRLAKLEAKVCAGLSEVLGELNKLRRETAAKLSARLEEELRGLGFASEVKVIFEFTPVELYPARPEGPELCEERARILWRPNPGQPAQALDKIASGGELSRFLLAVIGIKAEALAPTLIFDEVDAGIGGATLNRVGERLRALASRQQVLLITHWPQLAALAETHFKVQKIVRDGQTYTLCAKLGQSEIKEELKRMAGEE